MTDPHARIALLPCPFCGGTSIEEAMRTGVIYCERCVCQAPNTQSWNRRAGDARIAQLEAENVSLRRTLIVWETAYLTRRNEHMDTAYENAKLTLARTSAPASDTTAGAALIERVASAMWKAEADRAAPNVGRNRTPEMFAEQSGETRARWIGLASAALRALAGETE